MEKPIKIAVVIGTVRPASYTAKAAALVVEQLQNHPKVGVDIIDPAKLTLQFPGADGEPGDAQKISDIIKKATGVIIATPEYHGSFSGVTKLIIENLGFPSALATKPVALLGVAAGRIGAVKSLEQLRCVCSHVGALVLPGPVSVAMVRTVFDEAGNCTDQNVGKQVRTVATTLIDYIQGSVCPRVTLEEMARAGK